MTENKGDLISREALKETLKSNCKPELCHDYGTNWCEACCRTNDFEDLIDNAPTVEAIPTELHEKILDQTTGELLECQSNLRQQGEWLPNYTSQFMNPGKQCSLCGKIVEFSENYCPQCGANMRGEE